MPCAPSPNPSPSAIFPFYRTIPAAPPTPSVHISWLDRSSFLKISSNAMTLASDRGFRSARANVAIRQGSWYYEVKILRGDGLSGAGSGLGEGIRGNAHVRVGWGRREANIDGPVGMDGYGYGIRDVNGEKIHLSRPKPYGREFKTGDIVGCRIHIPQRGEYHGEPSDPRVLKRRRVPIRYKGQLYFEMDEYTPQKEMEALIDREGKAAAAAKAQAEAAKVEGDKLVEKIGKSGKGATTKNAKKSKNKDQQPTGPVVRDLPILPGSKVEFYLNGDPLGTAFEDIYDFLPLPPVPSTMQSKKSGHHGHESAKEVLHDDGTLGYYPMVEVK
jgi:COMPASS component BRE2